MQEIEIMNFTPEENGLLLKIDLRDVRAASQRNDEMDSYNLKASRLSMDIMDIVNNEESIKSMELSKYALDRNDGAGRKDAAQTIESITLAITSLGGIGGISAIVLKIIDAMKNKIPTTYEVEVPEVGKMKFTGKKIGKEDVAILESMITDLENKRRSQVKSSDNGKAIIIHTRKEE